MAGDFMTTDDPIEDLNPGSGTSSPTVEELQRRLEASEAQNVQTNSDLDRERARMDEWLRGDPRNAAPAVAPEPPLGPPPNPIEDPEQHQRWLLERDRRQAADVDRRFEQQEQRTESRIQTATREANLWQLFVAKHPNYAQRSTLARTAFTNVARRGLSGSDDDVVDAVKAEMVTLIGAPLEDLQPPADRTDGIRPGDPPTPKRKPAPRADEDAPSTMHESISQRQIDLGLI